MFNLFTLNLITLKNIIPKVKNINSNPLSYSVLDMKAYVSHKSVMLIQLSHVSEHALESQNLRCGNIAG